MHFWLNDFDQLTALLQLLDFLLRKRPVSLLLIYLLLGVLFGLLGDLVEPHLLSPEELVSGHGEVDLAAGDRNVLVAWLGLLD